MYELLIPAVFGPAPDLVTGVRDFFAGAAAHLVETGYEDACPIATVALEVSSSSEILRLACADVFESWIEAGTEMYERSGLTREQARELTIAMVAALEGALRDAEPRVRRAAAAGLGNFVGDDVAGRALAERLDAGDASVFVEAELALALGKTRSPEALSLLPRLVDRPSYMDLVASRAIDGLGQTGDERALPLIRDAWRPGAGFPARRAVVGALAELARGTPQARAAREAIELRLGDRDFRVRGEAAVALGRLGLTDALPALRSALAGELDGRTRRRINDAIRDIEEGRARPRRRAACTTRSNGCAARPPACASGWTGWKRAWPARHPARCRRASARGRPRAGARARCARRAADFQGTLPGFRV